MEISEELFGEMRNTLYGINPWIVEPHGNGRLLCRYCHCDKGEGHAADCQYLELKAKIKRVDPLGGVSR